MDCLTHGDGLIGLGLGVCIGQTLETPECTIHG